MPVFEIYRHYRMDQGLSAHDVHFTPHLNTCKYGETLKILTEMAIQPLCKKIQDAGHL